MRDAAGTEPEVQQLIREDHERRYRTQQVLVDLILDARPLRTGLDRDQAVATFFAVVNSDSYRLLVGHLGWSVNHWQQWISALLQHQFFGIDAPRRLPGPPAMSRKNSPGR